MTGATRARLSSIKFWTGVRWALAAVLVGVLIWRDVVPWLRAESNWRALLSRGTLRVGIDPGVAPFSFYDDSGWNGFDADMARTLAARLNLTLQSDPVGYDSMYDALQTNRVDVVISAVVVDPARTADFVYSLSYFDAGPRLVTALPIPPTADAMSALGGKRVAVSLGSEADRVVRYWERRVPYLQRLEVGSDPGALQALQAGGDAKADAALVDVLTPQLNAPWCGTTPCTQVSVSPRPLVIALRGSDPVLLDHINQTLREMKADGTLDQLQAKWMAGP